MHAWSGYKWFCLFPLLLSLGCQSGNKAAIHGITIYLDGAGNWGGGGEELRRGLRAAGYRGLVEQYLWTTSFNPLVDQLNIVAAKIRAHALSGRIQSYRRQYPNTSIHLVALSAGTGVATWAVEALNEDSKIDNMILLGSSLSHDYDMTHALAHMKGKIYVYYSPHDCVLEKVRIIGTIDGKRGVDSAGYIGLTAPPGLEDRVVNTAWSRDWLQYGWTGAHSDCTNAVFVRKEISRHILSEQAPAVAQGEQLAIR